MDGLRPIGGQEEPQPRYGLYIHSHFGNSKEDNIDNPNNEPEEQPTKKREAKAIMPNQTLYIRNLNEKIKKDGKLRTYFLG